MGDPKTTKEMRECIKRRYAAMVPEGAVFMWPGVQEAIASKCVLDDLEAAEARVAQLQRWGQERNYELCAEIERYRHRAEAAERERDEAVEKLAKCKRHQETQLALLRLRRKQVQRLESALTKATRGIE